MAEKIINGTFSGNLNGWSNVGLHPFFRTLGNMARGTGSGTSAREYILRQSFAKYGQTISAFISADIWYYATAGGDSDGYNNFRIELDIPGGGTVILYEAGYNDEIGSDTALVDMDISSYLVNNGTYYLRLMLFNRASITNGIVDTASYGEYDNVSILVTERFSHTSIDILGAGEGNQRGSSVSKSSILGLLESFSKIGGGDSMAKRESIGFFEIVGKIAKVVILEILGCVASLVRTYGYCRVDIDGNSIRLLESMSAKVVSGNVTRVVEDFEPPTEWLEIAPAATSWDQTR